MASQFQKVSNSSQLATLTRSKRKFQFHILLLICFQYRHDDKMIERLDSAGLGFFVKTTETQQRLGMDNV